MARLFKTMTHFIINLHLIENQYVKVCNKHTIHFELKGKSHRMRCVALTMAIKTVNLCISTSATKNNAIFKNRYSIK